MALKVRRDDLVLVVRGKDKGKRGKVQRALPREERVVVEGVNLVKRHVRSRGQVRQAGIVQQEASIHASKIMLICQHCNRPVRVGFRFLEGGNKVRVCKRCHEVIE
ncbi:MAG: 50S ribosomal protein L24 [Chloroflexi bacterium]|nr:50S ribosomal protein L24 [Chloroflexota bacterium]